MHRRVALVIVLGVSTLASGLALDPTASCVSAADTDLDGLSDEDEGGQGTDPYDSDTDDGGENDGSEVDHGMDPLDPSDDEIQALDWVQANPADSAVVLSFDVESEYTHLRLYRRPSGLPLYTLVNGSVPPTGVYTDGGLVNGTPYYYRMMAVDAGDHRSEVTPTVAATPSQHALFHDGFESGDVSRWAMSAP